MKTILVATDFSATSLNAANYAADMALAINADLTLLHVYQAPLSYSDMDFTMSVVDLEELARNDLKEFSEQLIQKRGDMLNIQTEFREGNFFRQLQTVCQSIKPYAVVMGSQGKTAAERLLFGGHAVHAMKHLEWPLITVPPGVKFLSVKKIGLACDFDDVTNTIPIDEIITLVKDFNAELYILNTGKEKVFNSKIVFESVVLRKMLLDLDPQYHFIAHDDTDEGIMDFAEKNHIDLLLLLPKRHNLFDTIIHKSHTKQLVLHSHVPVMALHQ